jgi:hypothetical protein
MNVKKNMIVAAAAVATMALATQYLTAATVWNNPAGGDCNMDSN